MRERTVDEVFVFADGLDHPECVAVHRDGSVWAGGEAGQLYRISPDGREIKAVANTGGFVLGLAFAPGYDWLVLCDLKKHCLWKFELQTGNLSLFAEEVEGKPLRIPNFPVFDAAGNLYVSESGAFRQVNGAIYRFDAAGRGTLWHRGPFDFPNGMALSADGKKLYVVCSFLPGIEQVVIRADGSAGERSVLVHLPRTCPDGIAVDTEGHLLISCYAPNAIYCLGPDGQLTTLIHDWEAHGLSNPTNIAFGGAENRQLFIANLGRWHIARMELDHPGIPLTKKGNE